MENGIVEDRVAHYMCIDEVRTGLELAQASCRDCLHRREEDPTADINRLKINGARKLGPIEAGVAEHPHPEKRSVAANRRTRHGRCLTRRRDQCAAIEVAHLGGYKRAVVEVS